jgi:uncharacterized protein (TIGR02145 family)
MKIILRFSIILGFFLISPGLCTFSQVAISTDDSNADPSAMLEVKSTSKGLLIPRMTHAQLILISSPANGLMVYCTDCGTGGAGALAIFTAGSWNTFSASCLNPLTPVAGIQVASPTQVLWNWSTAIGATGYKWNTTNDYASATDMGTALTRTETGLTCNTAYNRYAWAYNACGNSSPVTLSQSTSSSPLAPTEGAHIPSGTQIVWNWNSVSGATGYRWNTTNDYASAFQMGTATTRTETGLTYNTAYTRYAWAYNGCGNSTPVTLTQSTLEWSCASSITINHVTSGGVAPVNKTVTYGIVTNIPGESSKCWITSNLGADHQATAFTDATEASAGWYWQFNRKQGFKHDGTTRTPNTTWITSISENLDWQSTNDPCALELGTGWRIPTNSEWVNVDAAGAWIDWNGPWNSDLKIHAAGYLWWQLGPPLNERGLNGYYWSGTQSATNLAWHMDFQSGGSNENPNWFKAHGFSVRCLLDAQTQELPTVTSAGVTNILQTTATSGGNVTSDGGPSVTTRGVCWSTSSNPTTANSHTIDGSGTGIYVSSLTGLTLNTLYYIRAYATNSVATAYGNEMTFTTLANLPTVSTTTVTSIGQTAVTSGGNVTSDGGASVTVRGVCWNTSSNPVSSGSHTMDGSGTGTFVSSLTGLTANTLYYVRAYATNSAGTAYGNEFNFTTYKTDAITDNDGNYYNIVTIGTQTWIVGNLKTTKYRDGTSIPLVTDNTAWSILTTPGFCWYNNNESTYKATYGALYNWYTTSTGNLCPTGWHVPTDAEWTTLTTYLGGESVASGKLKETGTTHWTSPNSGATNETGFTALPGGFRSSNGTFNNFGTWGLWWSASEAVAPNAWNRSLSYNDGSVHRVTNDEKNGFSVRCLRDAQTQPILTTTSATNILQTTATSGGNITSDGGASVTARGVCWSTSTNPTIAESHTTDGSGTGVFVSNLIGLTTNTLYYVRAYATNSVGTAYGNEVSFTTLSFAIGQSYGGGIIFYIDGTSQHGLISATSDQTSAPWGCSPNSICCTFTAIGTGQANTTAIINGCSTAGIAARICDDLVLNGYSDWFLPSKDELNQMLLQNATIGSFSNGYYWSSSERSSSFAWDQLFVFGSQNYDLKGSTYYVRAIRAF